jgi:hypothetical protein
MKHLSKSNDCLPANQYPQNESGEKKETHLSIPIEKVGLAL